MKEQKQQTGFEIPDRFLGQVALVAGGAHGIGKALALRLAREGAKVAIGDIDYPAARTLAGCMRKSGHCALAVRCDVRSASQVKRGVDRVLENFGQIDVLMYVAGICKGVEFDATDEHLWDLTLDTNLKGAYLCAHAVSRHMRARRTGSMIFMASTNSYEGEALQAPYNASKAGLFLLTKTLARELGPCGIRANAVAPGFIRTRLTEPFLADEHFMKKYFNGGPPLIPLGRIGEPEDVSGPALFLASRDAAFVNGALLLVDGGQLA